MAAVTKLKPGTRVRLKRNYQTPLGNHIEAGLTGRVSRLPPFHNLAQDEVLVYIYIKPNRGSVGWWLPASHLVRLKPNAPSRHR